MRNLTTVALAVCAALGSLTLSGCGSAATAGPAPQRDVALKIRQALTSGAAAGEAAAGAAAATGTGWGTLRGRFKYMGDPPKPAPLKADKDTEVCGKDGALMDNSLLVASDGGISNIVLYARANRVHESAQPVAEGKGETVVFDQKNCMFKTHVLAYQMGNPLEIKNSDPIGHNTKIDPRKGTAFNQTLSNNQEVPYAATAEEALPATVSCSIHPWMRGYLLPRKDKYFAVTKPDGTFEIPNLPAGEDVEIQVWHERASGPGNALALDRKDQKWTNKGRFKVKLEPDQQLDLALDVPAAAFK